MEEDRLDEVRKLIPHHVPAVVEPEALVLPHSGQVLDLSNAPHCVQALEELRALEMKIKEVKRVLSDAIAAESRRLGSKTIALPGGLKAEVRGGRRVLWDIGKLEGGLRRAGMPEDRIREIIREEVSYSVLAREATRAATANPEYAEIIEAAKTVVDEQPTISVSRR